MGTAAGYTILDQRGVLAVGGEDRSGFLQGLVSNDVRRVAPDRVIYTLFLTAQGKYLHDFFLAAGDDALLLDVEAARRDDLLRRLKMYKLRSKITLEDRTDRLAVAVAFGDGAAERLGLPAEAGAARPFAGGLVFTDPRLPALGVRALLPRDALDALADAGFAPAPFTVYDTLRLRQGVPDGSRDLEIEKAIPLENNLDALNAISWDKGCYMGQELTARTRYRALIRKRLFPVVLEGTPPDPGTPVTLGDKAVGEIRSTCDNRALALLRLEDVDTATQEKISLSAAGTIVVPEQPSWLAS
ncbi:YgfZ/GcvT domain-containing protein [Azospirillum halopraeferens]|uniref:CAF17-like 4Fe-4S cluster assembly/insertion protein YgfZ n=1 Tax=Azospirillum halopraeferens TaxID=34010 RepID=UPI0003FA97E7|nr:folate-binding protein YgfZ [Azospirillum halopraeferens]